MKNKRIAVIVCVMLVLCIALTACNENNSEENSNSSNNNYETAKNMAVVVEVDEEAAQIRVAGGNADSIGLIGKDCIFMVNNAAVSDMDGSEISFSELKSGDSIEFELDGDVNWANPVQAKIKSIKKSFGAKYYSDTAEAQMLKYSRALEGSEYNWIYALTGGANDTGDYEDYKKSEDIWKSVVIKDVEILSADVRAHKACYELQIEVEDAGTSAFDPGMNIRYLWLECAEEGWFVYGLMTSGTPDESWWNEGVGEYDSVVPSEALAELIGKITSSPTEATTAQEYIDAHPDEYKALLGMDERALFAIFSKFEQGGQDGIEGSIMAAAALDILGDEYTVVPSGTGQEWYNSFKAYVVNLYKDKSKDYIRENLPKTAVLFEVIDKAYTGIEIMPTWEYEGESHPLSYKLFPNVWNGVSYDRETYRQVFYEMYEQNGKALTAVPDGAKITIEFFSDFPDSVSLIKDPYVLVENSKLDAVNEDAEYTEGEDTSKIEFTVDYGEAEEMCYIATAKWDNGNSVEIGLIFKK